MSPKSEATVQVAWPRFRFLVLDKSTGLYKHYLSLAVLESKPVCDWQLVCQCMEGHVPAGRSDCKFSWLPNFTHHPPLHLFHAGWLGILGGNVRVWVFFVGFGVVKGGNVGWLVEAPPFTISRICYNKTKPSKLTLSRGWPTFGRKAVAVRRRRRRRTRRLYNWGKDEQEAGEEHDKSQRFEEQICRTRLRRWRKSKQVC